jgi:Protein of unknown function (DUF4236)
MTLRFFRRVRIVPGLRVNLSKSGASVSVGRRGAWFTTGPRGRRVTVGLPGTGLFLTQHRAQPDTAIAVSSQENASPAHASQANVAMGLFCVAVLVALVALIVLAG